MFWFLLFLSLQCKVKKPNKNAVKITKSNNSSAIKGRFYINVLPAPLEFVLYKNEIPKTVENFVQLSTGKFNPKVTYSNTKFHRLIKNFVIQGGDIINGNGTGSISIYNGKFNDESFLYKHEYGSISMANSGPNTNGSQFFICFDKIPHLDGKHVVFGKVVNIELLDILNNITTDKADKPINDVIIQKIEIDEQENERVL
ncbi:hypothetical protein NCER_101263 [Vairimorpha ceranae BRL01]|uniref:Peptidyl-prolyl cis-trans isomerase n=2 Tax=Vairimorpha ceranae TaxID=40302 RepID=C4V9L3_VAIC1|nr:peptidyl-prolyl cis-trans isomerase [Vairimorpha ceranae]EEQ82089.1 hypothetical protein NCER_101263 [Vairimorpha ceranae BRL01]KAF5141780.1 hypothetical protein G9O61_00g000630 [Vairimorpha ceranae]KKO74368.1 peptidyl-prolyl cis-trans isomerase [Vairimorpha ceranae]